MKFVKASEVKFVRGSGPSTSSSGAASNSGSSTKKKMTFVKASDDYESTSIKDRDTDTGETSQQRAEFERGMQKYGLGFKGGNVKKAIQEYSQASQASYSDELVGKFYQLANSLREYEGLKKNAVEVTYMAAQKAQMQPTIEFRSAGGEGFMCELSIDCVFVSLGIGPSKKSAKTDAFEKGLCVLCKPYLHVNKSDPKGAILESSDEPFDFQQSSYEHPKTPAKSYNSGLTKSGRATQSNIGNSKKRKLPTFAQSADLSDIIVMEPAYFESINSMMVLHETMAINRVPMYEYEFDMDQSGEFVCTVMVGGSPLAEATASTKNEAKLQAADIALAILKEMCWTIQIKQKYEAGDDSVSKDELVGDIQKSMEAIPASNIGNQLLKKMGWMGGGVGKTGQGIAEPVRVDAVINRSGLGLQAEQGINKSFLPRVKTMLQDYARSDDQGDLTFSPELRKEERAIIHKEAQKIGLKSHSHGKGEERFLVISRRMSVQQIMQHIMACGGETPKYRVKAPGAEPTNS